MIPIEENSTHHGKIT
uniref:Uncharacterized protein n=1 Tax=Arundo donax TaxID=35708 RepID=A0A0A8Y1S5_ARUDO